MNKSESKYFHTAERMDRALLSLLLEKDFEYITVKELCNRAEVNRSTFYLHYENTADLLEETVAMIHAQFQESAASGGGGLAVTEETPLEELFLVTDRRLIPYLEFVRENRHVYKAIHSRMELFGGEKAYTQFFQEVFSPILSRYGVDRENHGYIMTFYRYGLTAILMEWVDADCRESVEQIAGIIKLCVGESRR